jgi:hypothetical protein
MNFSYKDLQTPIEIRNDTTWINLTGRFLLPQIKLLDETFNNNYNKTNWLGFGLCDRLYDKYNEFDNKLFMLASNKSSLKYWLNNYEYYIYQDGELNKVMIIIDLPINNRDQFFIGEYSKLGYEPNIIVKFIKYKGKESLSSSWSVINKTEQARVAFQEKVNKDFNVNVIISDEQEFEYPPVLPREIFNLKTELVLSH